MHDMMLGVGVLRLLGVETLIDSIMNNPTGVTTDEVSRLSDWRPKGNHEGERRGRNS